MTRVETLHESGRERNRDALRAAALAVTGEQGEEVFAALARHLAGILDVAVAMIAVYADDERTRMRTLATRLDGEVLAGFEYGLAGSPCRHVVGRKFHFVPAGVHAEFPPGTLFAAQGMDSYAALALNDASGAPLGLVAVMDRAPLGDADLAESILKIFAARITAEVERLRAVAALRDSEASYRAIFEASEDPIFVHDWDTGAILDVSPKAQEVFGYTPLELRALRVGDMSANEPPYTETEARQWIEQAKVGPPLRIEWHARHRDGHLMWHEVRLKRATIAGRPRILAFIRDITARVEAEQRLRASEKRYRLLFEMESDAILVTDARTLDLLDANRAAEELWGYTREELLELKATDLSAEKEATRAALQGESGTIAVPVRWHRRKDGSLFPVEITLNRFELDGRKIVLSAIRDITERRQREEALAASEARLRQAQKMEAIGHLTGGIAHDFNNLLTAIMGYVTLAAERCGERDATLAGYLDQAGLSCVRARDLIRQMLTFSRGGRGAPRALQLAPAVREGIKLLRASLPSTVALAAELDERAPPVLLDPVQLDQVLMNLVINARDAMSAAGDRVPPGGDAGTSGDIRITVRATRAQRAVCASCRKSVEGELVELSVADSGPGIPAAVQDRMFEPFFTTKPAGRGTGMGLSTVHGIVHEHGGHVVVDTAPGCGTTFRVLLPPERTHVPASESRAVPDMLARRTLTGRVAVVDDEPAVLRFMTDLLVHWGMSVAPFSHARAALDALAGGDAFDLLITDQTMPGMTGLELARAARALQADLPVVLYTGYGDAITEGDIVAAGVAELVPKPVEPSVLFAALRRRLRSAALPQ